MVTRTAAHMHLRTAPRARRSSRRGLSARAVCAGGSARPSESKRRPTRTPARTAEPVAGLHRPARQAGGRPRLVPGDGLPGKEMYTYLKKPTISQNIIKHEICRKSTTRKPRTAGQTRPGPPAAGTGRLHRSDTAAGCCRRASKSILYSFPKLSAPGSSRASSPPPSPPTRAPF